MPEMSEHLKQIIYARRQFREAEQRLQQKAFDAQYPPESINNTKFTVAQEQETYYRLQELLNPNYKRPVVNTDSEEVQTKKRLEELRESRAKAEAHLKAEEANYVPKSQRVETPTPTKAAYGIKVAESDRLNYENYLKTKTANELKRSSATREDAEARRIRKKPIASSDFSRKEDAKYRELQRNYDVKKAAYNQKLAEAAQVKATAAANPAAPKPRFGIGDVSPITKQVWGKINPPGKVWFNKGTYNPITGKPWATPKPPTSPGGSGLQEMVQKVQRNIAQRFNAAKASTASKQAGGPTSKASSPSATAVLERPGAEIPHMAVGAAATGVTLSSRAIPIASNGAALQSGVGAAISFGVQVASGVDPLRAGFNALGAGVGSFVGQVALTALTFPFFGGVPGGIVGQIGGAYAGQLLADSLYNVLFGKAKAVKPKIQTQAPSFTGGQLDGVSYNVVVHMRTSRGDPYVYTGIATGPIKKAQLNFTAFLPGFYPPPIYIYNDKNESTGYTGWTGSGGPTLEENDFIAVSATIISASRVDGLADTGGNIPSTSTAQPLRSTVVSSPYAPPSTTPLNSPTKARSPYAPPPAVDLPLESNKRKPLQIEIPAGKSVTISSPDGVATTIPASDKPRILNIPRPLPRSPNAEPEFGLTPVFPVTVTSPNSEPIILTSLGTGPVTISMPGSAPYTFNPTSDKNAPLPLSQIKPFSRNQPSTLNPIPGATPTTTPATTPTTTPSNPSAPATQGDLDNLLLPLGIVGGLAGLGFLIKQIHDRTAPDAIETAAAAGTCRTTQPGGCSSNLVNEAGDRNNQNLLDRLGAGGAQGAELGLLNVMNNKLGNQIPGGLAGGVGRLSNFLGIDRVLNILNLMAILHNGFMLSNQLKVTLLEVLSSVGNATGLLQSAEGENVDLNATYNKGITSLIDSVIGESERVRLELLFKKYNRIYQAGANIMNSVQSMMSSIGNVVETTAEYTGKIGNSLKGAGAIAENAFQWMAEKQNARTSKFLQYQTSIGGVTQALEVISEIAETVVEGQQAKIDADKQVTDFKKSLETAEKNPSPDNKAVADEIKRQKDAATANTEGDDDTGLFSNLTQ